MKSYQKRIIVFLFLLAAAVTPVYGLAANTNTANEHSAWETLHLVAEEHYFAYSNQNEQWEPQVRYIEYWEDSIGNYSYKVTDAEGKHAEASIGFSKRHNSSEKTEHAYLPLLNKVVEHSAENISATTELSSFYVKRLTDEALLEGEAMVAKRPTVIYREQRSIKDLEEAGALSLEDKVKGPYTQVILSYIDQEMGYITRKVHEINGQIFREWIVTSAEFNKLLPEDFIK